MKYVTYFFMLLISIKTHSQCKDIYGKKTECPTEADSLTIYNNALKVYEYYENNPKYQKTRTRNLKSASDKLNIFEDLATARRLFHIIRRQYGVGLKPSEKRFAAGKPVASYKDITYNQYYQEIDEYRFYQRELENQIVNIGAPTTMFDIRIAPILVNEYNCIDSTDSHFGDLVNIVLYVPVTVKPFMLLTEDELISRNEILSKIDANYIPQQIPKPTPIVTKVIPIPTDTIKPDTSMLSEVKPTQNIVISNVENTTPTYIPKVYSVCTNPTPTYAYNTITGGTIIGFICGKYFVKITPDEYNYYRVPHWARNILENEKSLSQLLKDKFGNYLLGIK